MRILGLFLNEEPRTGGHRRYLELLSGLALRGHTVFAIVAKGASLDPASGSLRTRSIQDSGTGPVKSQEIRAVVRLPVSTRPRGVSLLSRLSVSRCWARSIRREARWLVERAQPDLVLVFGETTYPAARAAATTAGAPLVVALRSNMRAELSALGAHRGPAVLRSVFALAERTVTSLRERSLARTARRLVFQTEFDREDFVRRHPIDERRTSVVPNSIDASWFDPAQRDANRSSRLHRIIFVGTLNRRKGVMVLLDAFSRLVGKGIDISLDVVGSGPLDARVRKLVERDGLNDRVFLHGPKPGAVSLIAQADLLAVPSLYDSFPNVLLEALHTGTPALGTRAGGIPEILAADELLVPPGDPATLAAAIERLVRDPDAYRKAKQLVAKRRATFEFDWVGRFEAELEYSLSHSRP